MQQKLTDSILRFPSVADNDDHKYHVLQYYLYICNYYVLLVLMRRESYEMTYYTYEK